MEFHKGDRVRINKAYADAAGLKFQNPDRLGTIRSEPKQPEKVGVIWDGAKTHEYYSVDFLDKIE